MWWLLAAAVVFFAAALMRERMIRVAMENLPLKTRSEVIQMYRHRATCPEPKAWLWQFQVPATIALVLALIGVFNALA